MIIAVDFDGTLVEETEWDYLGDLTLLPRAKETLLQLKQAGHQLLLFSARNNQAIFNRELDPLVRAGAIGNVPSTEKTKQIARRRWKAMVAFVGTELPGVFDAIDDGKQGKPRADLFIDNLAVTFGLYGMSWPEIARVFGV